MTVEYLLQARRFVLPLPKQKAKTNAKIKATRPVEIHERESCTRVCRPLTKLELIAACVRTTGV